MNTHSFHLSKPIKARLSVGQNYTCAIFEAGDSSIEIYAHGEQMRDCLTRAVEAFAAEMQRAPVAQQIAEAAE